MELTYLPATQTKQQMETARQRLARLQSQELLRPLQTDEEFHAVGQFVTEVKAFRKEWDAYTKPIRKATKDAHAEACRMFNEIDDPLEFLENRAIPFLSDYDRRKKIILAEQETILNAEVAKTNGELPPDVMPMAVTLPKLTAPDGLRRTSTWKAEVKDLMALVKAVAAGKMPLAYLSVNQQALNLQAKALKGEMKIPGVVAVEEQDFAARAR